MSVRFGIGYDIHRFEEGRDLILGGVNIPYEKGLVGHSDADVLLHAICDAILGALGKGDIGEHFPNTDPAFKDVSSLVLLTKVNEFLKQDGYVLGNIDSVIQAQEPNIKKYKEEMRSQIAQTLEIDAKQVNIKATTLEGIGALGKREGIAAFASAVLFSKE